MPVAVTMKGLLEPVVLEDSFLETSNALNVAAAKGMEFIVTRNVEGDPVALSMHNILFIQEQDFGEPNV
jgi:hypothetical protein